MSFREIRGHYERHPYPHYPLLSSVRRHDTYAMNLQALWARFNGELLPAGDEKILLAGCGAFAPYPMSLANPAADITCVDLAEANLRRARHHCLIHRRRNCRFLLGDFLDPATTPGPFHFIEAFGVLHHLDDPAAGLQALERRLLPGGIVRVMVYGRYARQEAESIRRAVKMLGMTTVTELKRLFHRAGPGSRVREYLDASWESRTDSGLADLFLHPNVHTYRMDEFLEMVSATSLKPLLFTHSGALADPVQEIIRFRELDRKRETFTNIICYLGHETESAVPLQPGSSLFLNPALTGAVSLRHLFPISIIDRLGHANPSLDRRTRSFLRRFTQPVLVESLSEGDLKKVAEFVQHHFLAVFVKLENDYRLTAD